MGVCMGQVFFPVHSRDRTGVCRISLTAVNQAVISVF